MKSENVEFRLGEIEKFLTRGIFGKDVLRQTNKTEHEARRDDYVPDEAITKVLDTVKISGFW